MKGKNTFKAVRVQPDWSVKVDEIEFPEITDDEVLVRIIAAPINPSDVGKSKGTHDATCPPPYGIGFEGAGIVAQVGKNHASRLKVGDKVTALVRDQYGSWAEYAPTRGDYVFPMRSDISFEEACSHFVNPGTVLMMLRQVQKEGHKAVVLSPAGSSLGKMLIRLCKDNGIKTINLVRRDDIKEELRSIGADYVLNTNDTDFETQLEEIAKKEQATKFYDAIGGEFTVKVLRKLPFGSVINIYGGLGGDPNLPLKSYDLFGGKTIGAFSMSTHYVGLPFEEKEKFAATIQDLLTTTFKTNVLKTFALEEFEEAIQHSIKHGTGGKTIFKI